jgi:hypothetical protein
MVLFTDGLLAKNRSRALALRPMYPPTMVNVAQRRVATPAPAAHSMASAVLRVDFAAPLMLTARLDGTYLCFFPAVILLTTTNSQKNFGTCK